MAFNENTRVKIPALLHLTQIGYTYTSIKNANIDSRSNIFIDIFSQAITRLNPNTQFNPSILLDELADILDYQDLGKAFYKRLLSHNSLKLIDLENFANNSLHVCTELTCKNGDDEFRPDITVLINGIPLVFIEVKKPNNLDGIQAERDRIDTRLQNQKFRRFFNATQFMIFSNNMEYDHESLIPLQGAFYASISTTSAVFNPFREEEETIFENLNPADPAIETFILKDNNLVAIKDSPEYQTNCSPSKPTNRIISSLLSPQRLPIILKFGLVYVNEINGTTKHILRYPQLFAMLAIQRSLKNDIKKGIIWHTQGSGKTALAYFNIAYLTDHFHKLNIVPKFYFIVDRIDLLTQAQVEFENRSLRVNIANSREDFVKNIASLGAIHNDSGQNEITVVNIQKFSEDSKATKSSDYDLNVQRIYFLDEVHRSYNPRGSFLANLFASDPQAIFIGLTGTPLIHQKLKAEAGQPTLTFNSKDVFGDYIHKYYYNLSIQDGYTLRLIREGIETQYKTQLQQALDQIQTPKGSIKKSDLFAHPKYVQQLANYIIADFQKSRQRLGDPTIGAMVVCESSQQARQLFATITENHPHISAALILHDVDDKETRRNNRDEFKRGNIDLLIVFNMLLTGFDAHRLKKLYLNRIVRDHNLLQTLTRVNRPYKNFHYGFVVDFADIRAEFDKTNAAYFQELQDQLGDEWQQYSNLFKSAEEIESDILDIQQKLFPYNLTNAEVFSEQINQIDDRTEIINIRSALQSAGVLSNLIRLYGHNDLADKLDFAQLKTMLSEVNHRLALVNQKEALESQQDTANIINMAIENIVFAFLKISEEELQLGVIDDFKNQIRQTREAMQNNFDHADPAYISLAEELERLFKQKHITQMTTQDINTNMQLLRSIYTSVSDLNRRDSLLKAKYEGDPKFTRIHKRLIESYPNWANRLLPINNALINIKHQTDDRVLNQKAVLNNESFFSSTVQPLVITSFNNQKFALDAIAARQINHLVVSEYIKEFKGVSQ